MLVNLFLGWSPPLVRSPSCVGEMFECWVIYSWYNFAEHASTRRPW